MLCCDVLCCSVGMMFIPNSDAAEIQCKEIFEKVAAAENFKVRYGTHALAPPDSAHLQGHRLRIVLKREAFRKQEALCAAVGSTSAAAGCSKGQPQCAASS